MTFIKHQPYTFSKSTKKIQFTKKHKIFKKALYFFYIETFSLIFRNTIICLFVEKTSFFNFSKFFIDFKKLGYSTSAFIFLVRYQGSPSLYYKWFSDISLLIFQKKNLNPFLLIVFYPKKQQNILFFQKIQEIF